MSFRHYIKVGLLSLLAVFCSGALSVDIFREREELVSDSEVTCFVLREQRSVVAPHHSSERVRFAVARRIDPNVARLVDSQSELRVSVSSNGLGFPLTT